MPAQKRPRRPWSLLRFFGRGAGGVFLDQDAQRLARGFLVAEFGLRTGDVQHRIGRLDIVGPRCHDLLLCCDRNLVVAGRIVGVADPVLCGGYELAIRVIHDEGLKGGDAGLVIPDLELIERRLVGFFFLLDSSNTFGV